MTTKKELLSYKEALEIRLEHTNEGYDPGSADALTAIALGIQTLLLVDKLLENSDSGEKRK